MEKMAEREAVTIRFVGDSGDGMQLTGIQFTSSSALFGNDVSTFPDFPSEIRAPAGTVAGVSGFQLQLANHDIFTPGDFADCLVAMNPAALKKAAPDLAPEAIIVVNADAFTPANITKAGFSTNPLEDGSLDTYRLVKVPITSLTLHAVSSSGIDRKESDRCKNFFALGLTFWLFERSTETTENWIRNKFARNPSIVDANLRALAAGFDYGDTVELMPARFNIGRAALAPGTYRQVAGNEAIAFGLAAAAQAAGKPLYYGTYPITPASEILHELAKMAGYNVHVFQAEDEIAAICASIGAAFSGAIAATGTSGPGLCLKSEAIGLAIMTELPLVIVNVQRGGPSTGLPTKTEQSDLLQAFYGRNGESPLPILAPQSPSDCYAIAYEAVRIAVKTMGPVMVLSDGFIGLGSEPWRIPDEIALAPIPVHHPSDPVNFHPYVRDPVTLARPWAIPGAPGFEHRIGGLEKQNESGNVSHDPDNHDLMIRLREEKVAHLVDDIPEQDVFGEKSGKLLILGWGGTHGALRTATQKLQREGLSVSHAHLRYLNPFPRNLGEILRNFDRVLLPEINRGQLAFLIRANFDCKPRQLNYVRGNPFKVNEIVDRAREVLQEKSEVPS